MGWADQHVKKLLQGERVQFRPRGNSMLPRIKSGQLCTIAPVCARDLQVGDTVLCRVKSAQYLHRILAIQGDRFQIGNNRGRINGWVRQNRIYGWLISVED